MIAVYLPGMLAITSLLNLKQMSVLALKADRLLRRLIKVVGRLRTP